jgi:hypothetical protein
MYTITPHILAVYNCYSFGVESKVYDKITGSKVYNLYDDYSSLTEIDNLKTEILSQSEFRRIDKSKYYEIDKGELGVIYEYKANKMLIAQVAKKELSKLKKCMELCNELEYLNPREQKLMLKYSKFSKKAKMEVQEDIDHVYKCLELCNQKTFYQPTN